MNIRSRRTKEFTEKIWACSSLDELAEVEKEYHELVKLFGSNYFLNWNGFIQRSIENRLKKLSGEWEDD